MMESEGKQKKGGFKEVNHKSKWIENKKERSTQMIDDIP